MGFQVSMEQIARAAMKAEDVGQAFYRRIAGLATDPRVRQVCLFFSEQEKEHKETFHGMIQDPQAGMAREFTSDVIGLINQGMEKFKQTGFQSADFDFARLDLRGCLELALDIELETIAIYEEVREAMGQKYGTILYNIIHEEHQHATSIENVLKQQDPKRELPSREAKIVAPDTIVIRRRRVQTNIQDAFNVAVIFLIFVVIILAMTGPRLLDYLIQMLSSG